MRYNYSYMTSWEASGDRAEAARVQAQYITQRDLYLTISVLYIAGIRVGQSAMKGFKPWNLKPVLVGWNLGLAVFSILGSIRFVPDFYVTVRDMGVRYSVCSNDFYEYVPLRWCQLFLVSKIVELGDTLWLILRKKEVIFLHWYHHVTVMLGTWHGEKGMSSLAHWCTSFNYMVHSCMYTYYFLRSMGLKVPKILAMGITSFQIFQMFAGCFVVIMAIGSKLSAGGCNGASWESIGVAAGMYTTYMALFLKYFSKTYLQRPVRRKVEKCE